jgi:type II secretory pathway component PulM
MAWVRARRTRLLLLAGLLVLATVGSWAQTTSPLGATPSQIDPALRRRGDLIRLINQAKEDLLFTNNPEAAEQKCLEALAIDPENPDAKFFLAQAKRQLKMKTATGTRSPISSLPDAANLPDAVARSRPTTPSITMPHDRPGTATAPGSGLLRTAVVGEKAGYVPPKATPVWLSHQYLTWAAVILLGVILVLVLVMVYDRLLAGKRQRMAQAEFFEQMQAAATKQTFETPVGESSLTAMPDDDFPIGATVPSGRQVLPAPAGPLVADDAELDFWKGEDRRIKSSAPITAAESPSLGTQKEIEDEREVVPAGKAFGEKAFEFGPDSSRPAGPLPSSEQEEKESRQTASPVEAKPTPVSPSGRPVSTPKRAAEEMGPIALDGIYVQTPGVADFDERDRAGEPPHRPQEPSIEELPFMLDAPLERTETMVDESAASASALDGPDAGKPEEGASIRLDEDFPMAAAPPVTLESLMERAEEPGAGLPAGAPHEERIAELPENLHDEILISPGPREASDETVHLAREEITSESTLIDSQARHKAVFQDQLARGLASLEKGNYRDAVKFLSVAHAMDPTSDYVRDKLREAHEKRSNDPS